MEDQLEPLAWYLRPRAWPDWPPTEASTKGTGPWGRTNTFSRARESNGGVLGKGLQPVGGILGDLALPVEGNALYPWNTINGSTWDLSSRALAFSPAQLQEDLTPHEPSSWQRFIAANHTMPAHAVDRWSSDPQPEEKGDMAPEAGSWPPINPSMPSDAPGDILMRPPEPAPLPSRDFRTWLRDTLSDRNVRYYAGPGFYEALLKLHAITQLLPGSGTVQSTQDTSRASVEAQAGNYGKAATHLGMGAVNAALDWLPPAKLAIIGGTMAKTFPWNKLPTAMEMEAAGKSADEIWRATGLERAADQRWTFEIPDKGYEVHPNAGQPTISKPLTHAPLYEHHAHPGMREAYPDLANFQSFLGIGPRYGASYPDHLVVRAPDLNWAKSVGIHELKHLIDRVEKHPPGGSPSYFVNQGASKWEAYDLYKRLVGEVAARNAEQRLHISDRIRTLWPPQATEDIARNRQVNLYDDK
jgi:hypothetical protein